MVFMKYTNKKNFPKMHSIPPMAMPKMSPMRGVSWVKKQDFRLSRRERQTLKFLLKPN